MVVTCHGHSDGCLCVCVCVAAAFGCVGAISVFANLLIVTKDLIISLSS